MSESNRPDRIGSPVPLPLGQWHNSSNTRRKERELNSQGFNARSASNGVPSPIGLPFHIKSSGSRNRTCVWAINSRLPVPAQDPPHHISQRGRNRTDGLVRPRHAPCSIRIGGQPFPHAEIKERPVGFEPTQLPWQSSTLRLHHGRQKFWPDCQRSRNIKWDRTDLNRGHRSAWMPDWSNPVKSRGAPNPRLSRGLGRLPLTLRSRCVLHSSRRGRNQSAVWPL